MMDNTTSTIIDPTITTALVVAVTVICLGSSYHWRSSSSSNDKDTNKPKTGSNIPDAIGGNFLIGNALQYKESPTDCIRSQERLTGSKLFRLNLAGRRMIIVGSDPQLQKQIASLPESVLSSTRAVAEIGFEYSLGHFNVYYGTAWHKQVLKDYIMGTNFATKFLPNIYRGLEKAIEIETTAQQLNNKNSNKGNDLFIFVRRCVLRATLDVLVTPLLLAKDPTLLEELMIFQDSVEDTTAKAAVLPRWIALPLCLWPTQKARAHVEQRITKLLSQILVPNNNNNKEGTAATKGNNKDWGPWLQHYAHEGTTPSKAAEHLIGLIFAGHKNPSIGAAQTFCFLRSELTPAQQTQAYEEAKILCQQFHKAAAATSSSSSFSLEEALVQAKTIRKCVLETMRFTAHTLGAVRYANQDIQIETYDVAGKKRRTYKICKGETVSMAHHTMHMEESIWGHGHSGDSGDDDDNDNQVVVGLDKFSLDRPEWNENENDQNGSATSTTTATIGIPVDHYKLTTFSNGTHKCPGEKVALAEMQIQVALLLVKDTQLLVSKSSSSEGEAGSSLLPPLPPVSFERATLAQRDGPVPFTIHP